MEKEQLVTDVLKDLGISAGRLGYYYLRDAILYRMDKGFIKSGTIHMYHEVAKMHNATSTQVERAIRTAIEKGTLIGNQSAYDEMFRYTMETDGHIKNGTFINTVAEFCMRLYNEHK